MTQFTNRLSLTKPGGGSSGTNLPADPVDIDVINNNMDKIDAALGAPIITSTTRPALPFTGQVVYETDTGNLSEWNGSTWVTVLATGYSEASRTGQAFANATSQVSGSFAKNTSRSVNDSWVIYNAGNYWQLQPGYYILSVTILLGSAALPSGRSFIEFQNNAGTSIGRNGTSSDGRWTLTIPYRVTATATDGQIAVYVYQTTGAANTPTLSATIQRVSGL